MDGFEYEKYCIRYLQKHGYKNVELTRSGADQGLDIIAYRHHIKYGFQCKYYEKPVGNAAVQEAYAGAAHYGCDKAAVITNTTFTKSAMELAEDTDVLLYSHVDPEHSNRWFHILQIYMIPGIVYCLFSFYHQSQSHSDDIQVLYTSFFFLGLLCGMFSHGSLFMTVLSIILCFTCVLTFPVSAYVCYVFILLLFMFIHFLILFCHHVQGQKQNHRKQLEEDQETLHQNILETLQKEIETELNCPVSLTNVSFTNKSLVCTCVSQNYIQDLPLLAYSLEQRSAANDHRNHYELTQLSQRSIKIQITPE